MTKDPNVARPEHLTDASEGEIVARVNQMLDRAKEKRAKVAGSENENWETLFDFYVGGANHWKGYPGPLTGYQQHTNNRIGRNIEIAEALLEEMNISAEVHPQEPGDEVAAALLDVGKDAILSRDYNRHAISLASRYARIIGTGYLKVWWDSDLTGGLGDVRVQMWPAEDIWIDPDALDLDGARYVITQTRMDAAEVESRYGLTEPETSAPKDSELGERADTQGASPRETTNTIASDGTDDGGSTHLMPGKAFFSSGDSKREVVVREVWVRDDPEKWPNGRHIVIAGKRVVIDEDQPYNHGKWPFAHMVDVTDPKSFYGDAAGRQAIELNRELNLVESLIALGLHLNTVPAWLRFPQGRVKKSDLQKNAAKPTAVIDCAHPGFAPKRLELGNVNPRLFDYRQMLIESIDKAMRVQDVIPPGARGFPASGEVVRELRESQLVEVRQKAGNKARCLKRVVELTVSIIQQFYATDRWVRITGPLPNALEGMVDLDMVRPEGGVTDDSFWVKMNPDNMKHGWDIRIVESTWEPLSRRAQIDNLSKVAEKDGFNTVTVGDLVQLEQGGYQIERLKRKIRQREKAQAEAEAAQAQAQAGPPPGPPQGAPPQGGVM